MLPAYLLHVLQAVDQHLPTSLCLTCCRPGGLCSYGSSVYIPLLLLIGLQAWRMTMSTGSTDKEDAKDQLSGWDNV